MIEAEQQPLPIHSPPRDPPVLLKRLGNAVEANLARAKLESAGIPAFLGEQDAFSGGMSQGVGHAEVELFVPQSLVDVALDVLDAAPDEPFDLEFDAVPDDPGRRLSFRAFVCSVVAWLVLFMAPVGLALAVPLFVYALHLAFRATFRSHERDLTFRLRIVAASGLALLGLGLAVFLAVELAGRM